MVRIRHLLKPMPSFRRRRSNGHKRALSGAATTHNAGYERGAAHPSTAVSHQKTGRARFALRASNLRKVGQVSRGLEGPLVVSMRESMVRSRRGKRPGAIQRHTLIRVGLGRGRNAPS